MSGQDKRVVEKGEDRGGGPALNQASKILSNYGWVWGVISGSVSLSQEFLGIHFHATCWYNQYMSKSETPAAVAHVLHFMTLLSCLWSSAFGDSLAPCGQTGSVPSSLGLVLMMYQCKVSELLDSGVLMAEAGLFLLKNSHRVSCSQTSRPQPCYLLCVDFILTMQKIKWRPRDVE